MKDEALCSEGPFSPTHKRWWGEAGGSPKATTVGVRAVGAEVSFPSVFFPDGTEEFGVGRKKHRQGEEPSFPRIRKGPERGC